MLPKGVYKSVTWNSMNEDEKGIVGIFELPSKNDILTMEGTEISESMKFQIQVNCNDGEEGMDEADKYLRQFLKNIESAYYDDGKLEIIDVYHLGPKSKRVEQNGFNISIRNCEINIDYLIKEWFWYGSYY